MLLWKKVVELVDSRVHKQFALGLLVDCCGDSAHTQCNYDNAKFPLWMWARYRTRKSPKGSKYFSLFFFRCDSSNWLSCDGFCM